jgi:hypothetical protein
MEKQRTTRASSSPDQASSFSQGSQCGCSGFDLASLLAFVTAACVLVGFAKLVAASPWLPNPIGDSQKTAVAVFAALTFAGLLAGLFQARRQRFQFAGSLVCAVSLTILLLFSAAAAWNIDGEVASALYWAIIAPVGLVPPLLCAIGRFRASIAVCLALGGVTLPFWGPYIPYAVRLKLLHEEVAAIAEYADSTRRDTGEYPLDLAAYTFHRASLAHRIEYYVPEESPGEHYLLIFKLYDGDTTTREYSPTKGWYYYPD